MRYWKAKQLPAAALTGLVMLFAVGGLAFAQSPAAATRPTAAALSPTAAVGNAANTAQDIRDIRPPIHIPYGWLWAAYVAGGLVLAVLLLTAWRWYRRHGGARRKLLYELTLEKLEQARALMEPLKGYQFSIAVSEIVRTYIEKQFHVRAAHRTTQEFLHDLLADSHSGLNAYQLLLAEFLEHCDLAKFARWQLSVSQMEAMYQSARAFVIETGRPQEKSTSISPTLPMRSVSFESSINEPQLVLESSST